MKKSALVVFSFRTELICLNCFRFDHCSLGHIFQRLLVKVTHSRVFSGKEENICCMEISAGCYGNTLSNSMENLRSCQAKF